MKKVYERPMMVCDQFTADEFVAACTNQNGTHYKFKCDASSFKIWGFEAGGSVYVENGKKPGLQRTGVNADELLAFATYSPCKEPHVASKSSDFEVGYLTFLDIEKDVMVWRGENGRNVHCTPELEIENWETTKS